MSFGLCILTKEVGNWLTVRKTQNSEDISMFICKVRHAIYVADARFSLVNAN